MVQLEVKFDSGQLTKGLDRFKSFVPKCEQRARKEAIKKGVSVFEDSKIGAPSIYNIKKKELHSFTKTSDKGFEVESRLLTVGTTTHFSITPQNYSSQAKIPVKKRTKATATIKKGKSNKQKLPHAFIANPSRVGNTMLWGRLVAAKGKNRGKEALNPITTISAAQMLSNETVSARVMDEMEKKFEDRFVHHFEREEEKIAKH